MSLRRGLSFHELATHIIKIENRNTHCGLRGDFIEHLLALKDTHT